ncbi:MAG TPA: DUF4870 domain-containing protein [Candidatus Altiarchaeales archaeon]|nr:DUF4870 domain-containing protein [Candidatus Altiarchaeales archaeon]
MVEGESKKAKSKGSNDDNIMAAISHASVIIMPVIVPLIIWLMYKDKSKVVKFQALQALAYQLAVTVVLVVLWFAAIILSFVVVGFLLIPVVLLLALAALIYALIGAYKTFRGEDFRYALIGDLVAEKM